MTTFQILRHESNVETFAAGQTIFAVGQPGDVMYVVTAGEVDIMLNGAVIETVGPGGLLGEMALIDESPRSATAIAHSECVLAPINKKRFTFLVQQAPNFALQVMQVLAARLRRGNVVSFGSNPAQQSGR